MKTFKKVLLFILILSICPQKNIFAENPKNISISAKSAVVISADNDKVIYSKNENEHLPMASTTKIMTALLTLENAEKNNKNVTITNEMVPVEGSSMYLKEGDILSLESLAKGMLSVSGNDAAHSAAIAISGSIEAFSNLMNEKAEQIGMKDTHFVTPSGLDDKNHYSTAHDMAILGSCAMENSMFSDIVSQKKVDVPFAEPCQNKKLRNSNKLLKECDGCIGIKTGFTKISGRCLVSCVERNDIKLIAVTLNAPDDWSDHKKMYDCCFEQVTSIPLVSENETYELKIVNSEKETIKIAPKKNLKATVEKNANYSIKKEIELPNFVYAPIHEGEIVGKIKYFTSNNEFVGTVDIIAKESCCEIPKKLNIFQKIFSFLQK